MPPPSLAIHRRLISVLVADPENGHFPRRILSNAFTSWYYRLKIRAIGIVVLSPKTQKRPLKNQIMKFNNVLIVLVMTVITNAAFGQDTTSKAPAPAKIKPYKEVITSKAITKTGLFMVIRWMRNIILKFLIIYCHGSFFYHPFIKSSYW